MTIPIFNEFRDLFYPNGIKIVPKNIEDLLTVTGLAYWAMDDEMKYENGFIFFVLILYIRGS
jgi:LAGLIDADG DNA endonuclease family